MTSRQPDERRGSLFDRLRECTDPERRDEIHAAIAKEYGSFVDRFLRTRAARVPDWDELASSLNYRLHRCVQLFDLKAGQEGQPAEDAFAAYLWASFKYTLTSHLASIAERTRGEEEALRESDETSRVEPHDGITEDDAIGDDEAGREFDPGCGGRGHRDDGSSLPPGVSARGTRRARLADAFAQRGENVLVRDPYLRRAARLAALSEPESFPGVSQAFSDDVFGRRKRWMTIA